MNINIGLIGPGLMGLTHLLSLKRIIEKNLLSNKNAKIRVRGIADTNPDTLKNLRSKNYHDFGKYTTDPEEIFKDEEIDIVYITTPTSFHKEYYLRAAEEGKHVFCEKPLAFSLKDIEEMISAEQKHGILTQVGLVLRHCPVLWKLKQILKENSDSFGERLSFIFRDTQEWPIGTRTHPSEWRKDPELAHAGSLFEHSIHDVDMIEYLFADKYKLSGLSANVRHVSPLTQGRLEDVGSIQFQYSDGFTGNLTSIWNKIRMDERRVDIFLENGYVLLDGYITEYFGKFDYQIGKKKKRLKFNEITEEYKEEKNYPPMGPNAGPYLFESLSFLESVIEDEKPYPGLDIGYRAHEIIESAYQSSKEHRRVSLES